MGKPPATDATAAAVDVSSSIASTKLAQRLLGGWTMSTSECTRCKTVPLMRDPESSSLLCVVCDVAAQANHSGCSGPSSSGGKWDTPMFPAWSLESAALFEIDQTAIVSNVPTTAATVPHAQHGGSPGGFGCPSSGGGPKRFPVPPPPVAGKTAASGFATINLTNEDEVVLPEEDDEALVLTGDTKITPLTGAENKDNNNHAGAVFGKLTSGTLTGKQGSYLRAPGFRTFNSNLSSDDAPEFRRQSAMPLTSFLASRAFTEASEILKQACEMSTAGSVASNPLRAAALWKSLQQFDKAQLTLTEVVEKLTYRVDRLAASGASEDAPRLIEHLEALSKALTVIGQIDVLRRSAGSSSVESAHKESFPPPRKQSSQHWASLTHNDDKTAVLTS